MTRQASGGGMNMSDVTFYFSDGTLLSAKEAISSGRLDPGVAHREFILRGDVHLRLNDKSTFLR